MIDIESRSDEDDTADSVQPRRKKLRIVIDVESEDDKWDKWLFEDILTAANLRPRSFWVHDMYKRRNTDGEFRRICLPYRDYPDKFFKYFRMNVETFDYILTNVQDDIQKHSNRPSISPAERLSVTLRYLATGMSFVALSDSFLMSPYTISLIVTEVCDVIYKKLVQKHMRIPSASDFKRIAEEFEDQWNFPNAIGAIDGKHIRIKCPPKSGTMFFNYKRFYSIVLQGVADSNYKFIFIDVGAYGKQGDAGVFANSPLNEFIQDTNHFPPARRIRGCGIKIPYLFLADDAYPLRPNIMKPHSHANLKNEEMVFNGRLSRARRCIECSFGMMANKWRLLLKEIETDVELACDIVRCVTVLHNVILDREGIDKSLVERIDAKLTSGASGMGSLKTGRKYNSSTHYAIKVRDTLTEYFNSSEGCVPWQLRYIESYKRRQNS